VKRLRRFHTRLLLVRHEESGIALPVALFATVASLALAGTAVMSSVDVQQGSKRDSGTKSAIGAADAGANVAMMRLARDASQLATSTCLGGATPVGGWCPAVTGEVGGSTYSYRVSQAGVACGEFDLCVVATGTASGATRRVLVTFNQGQSGPATGKTKKQEEEEKEKAGGGGGGGFEGIFGVEDIKVEENGDVRVSMGTNGNVIVENNGTVCGNIRVGIGKKATIEKANGQCAGYKVTEGNVTLPPVSSFMPSTIATTNSNYRLLPCTGTTPVPVPTGCQTDTYTGNWKSGKPWEPSKKIVSTSNNSTLTLGGGDYFICKLELANNSHLIMPAGATVRLFFDTPEHCGLTAGSKQVIINQNANITATGYQPTLGHFDMPGLYLTGSPTIRTTVEWQENSGTNEFVLYAPNSDVILQNNSTFKGLIAGRTVHLIQKAVVMEDEGFKVPTGLDPWREEETVDSGDSGDSGDQGGTIVFTPQYYVECSGSAGSTPNAGC
jgi:hypothetical protein